MLNNSNEKFNSVFKIHFGNLKEDFKNNYYLATNERSVENNIMNCKFLCEKNDGKYAIVTDEVLGTPVTKYINLNFFESWSFE